MPGEPLPVQLTDAAFQAVVADVLIMPVFDDDEPTTLGLPAAPQAILAAARKQREFKAKPYEQFWIAAPSDWKCPRILAIGAGQRRDYSSERARRLAMAGGHRRPQPQPRTRRLRPARHRLRRRHRDERLSH